jgi:hypothetical protein
LYPVAFLDLAQLTTVFMGYHFQSMPNMNLRAFIGSSSETLNIANAIKHSLKSEIDCTVWTESFFRLSQSTIDTLSAGVDEFDLGIFVFGEDDVLKSRGVDFSAPRDNVIFEHGLFSGRLGPKRTFVVRPRTRTLKWLSDLEGFTPAQYDEVLAKTDTDKAVEPACQQIRSQLRSLAPQPGIFASGAWKRLGFDWWTYGSDETSNTIFDETGIQFASGFDIGLRFPQYDNLDATGRFCAVRLMSPLGLTGGRFYIALLAGNEKVLLSMSSAHSKEGWGSPQNEFMIRLPHLQPDRYESFVIDLEALEPWIGPVVRVSGFRLRPGLRISHFCVCDDLPAWLQDATKLDANDAPLVTIERPSLGAVVEREELVQGSFKNLESANALRVFVLSPDNFWYLQPRVTVADGHWQVKAYFGNVEGGAGAEYRIAALATDAGPIAPRIERLPSALGKSVVRVTRRG